MNSILNFIPFRIKVDSISDPMTELFKKTFRNLVVPKLTNAIFSKDEVAKIITIKLDINFDADTLTDVSKTVSVEGIPALSIEDLAAF